MKDFTAAQAKTARIVHGRCPPYGDGITFWPLAEVVREAAGITDEDNPEHRPREAGRDPRAGRRRWHGHR